MGSYFWDGWPAGDGCQIRGWVANMGMGGLQGDGWLMAVRGAGGYYWDGWLVGG
jgi:hypothetical protein